MNNDYKFLNPYNFVRYLGEGKESDIPEIKLLGRCTPPPHDRFVGLTGKIVCELEAVTPLFISDSEFVEEYLISIEDVNGELVKDLEVGKITNKLKTEFEIRKIPLSDNTIVTKENIDKWMIEDKEKKNLYHINKDGCKLYIYGEAKGNGHKSYRFYRLKNENGEEEFAIPSTSLRGMLRSVFEAATNSCFSVFEGGLLGKRERPENYDRTLLLTAGLIIDLPKNEDKPGCVKGMKYYKLNHMRFPKYKNKFRLNGEEILVAIVNDDVSDVKEYIKKEQIPDRYSISYLKTSDKGLPGITRKMNEYVFLDDGSSENFELSYQTYQNYIISNRNNKQVHTKVPKSGDTIWFRSQEKKIKEFGYAQIYRKPFEKSIGDLLTNTSQHLHPCSDYHKLCPACRLFGWVHQQPSNDLEKASYAGRVKISHADLIEEKGTLDDFPLAILSTPKPSTTFFYLLKNGKPDFYVKYDTSGAHLRGRKFYLHQKKAEEEKEYRRAGDIRDDQNRTIRDALKPGAKFEFTVEFENLAPVEFGAFLWSIKMENDMFHKIGLGKPLGFGSIKLNIESIRILDVEERYSSFSNNGYNIKTNQKKIFIKKFRDYMEKRYGKNFYELDNIIDIKTILGEHALNVHYPRTSIEPDEDGRNFQWFVNNKKYGKQCLKLASEDTNGFPLDF